MSALAYRPSPLEELNAGRVLPADTLPIVFANHALERFGERLDPSSEPLADLGAEQLLPAPLPRALRRLVRLLSVGEVFGHPRRVELLPLWAESSVSATGWLKIGDAVFPLRHDDGAFVAVTCITPESRARTVARRSRPRGGSSRRRSGKPGTGITGTRSHTGDRRPGREERNDASGGE